MAVLKTVRDGLVTRLNTISGLRAYDNWPGLINIPAAIVWPASEDYEEAIGTGNILRFEIVIMVQIADYERAQEALDDYLAYSGTKSIRVAIEGDRTLAGAVQSLSVKGWRNYGQKEAVGGVAYMGAILDVECWD